MGCALRLGDSDANAVIAVPPTGVLGRLENCHPQTDTRMDKKVNGVEGSVGRRYDMSEH